MIEFATGLVFATFIIRLHEYYYGFAVPDVSALVALGLAVVVDSVLMYFKYWGK